MTPTRQILVLCFLLLISAGCKHKPKQEYTVRAVVYFTNGTSDTIRYTYYATESMELELWQQGKKHKVKLQLEDYTTLAVDVTHFKQLEP